MSRSYRHSPYTGWCSDSDKKGKVQANSTLRAVTRNMLNNCRDFDNLSAPLLREVSNLYDFPKDCKRRLDLSDPYDSKLMRK